MALVATRISKRREAMHLSDREAELIQSIPNAEYTHYRVYLSDFDEFQQITLRHLIHREMLRFNKGEYKWLLVTGRGRRALMEWGREHR